MLVTARAHDCEEILQPTFRPRGDADSLELFRLKNDFMYSVFNKCLLSDMVKTIVRNHLDNMNAQQVWEEFATHMIQFPPKMDENWLRNGGERDKK